MNLFLLSPSWLLPLAVGNIDPSTPMIGQYNPATALEGYISA